jgi:hypothetical protein
MPGAKIAERRAPACKSFARLLRSETSGQTVTYATFKESAKPTTLERLITRTPVSDDLRFRRSAQRFELDTYHGDALPTELTGRVFSCLTWSCAICPKDTQDLWAVHSAYAAL